MNAHTHARTRSTACVRIQQRMHASTDACMHTCRHGHAYAHTPTRPPARMHACLQMSELKRSLEEARCQVPTHTRTCTDSQTDANTHTCLQTACVHTHEHPTGSRLGRSPRWQHTRQRASTKRLLCVIANTTCIIECALQIPRTCKYRAPNILSRYKYCLCSQYRAHCTYPAHHKYPARCEYPAHYKCLRIANTSHMNPTCQTIPRALSIPLAHRVHDKYCADYKHRASINTAHVSTARAQQIPRAL